MLKDLSGKTVYDLDREDFEELFCRQCNGYGVCPQGDIQIDACRGLVDCGLWDRHYRRRQDSKKE